MCGICKRRWLRCICTNVYCRETLKGRICCGCFKEVKKSSCSCR